MGSGVGKSAADGRGCQNGKADVNVVPWLGKAGGGCGVRAQVSLGRNGRLGLVVASPQPVRHDAFKAFCTHWPSYHHGNLFWRNQRGMDVLLMMDSLPELLWPWKGVGL